MNAREYVGTGFPPEEGKRLAEVVYNSELLQKEESIDVRECSPALLISAFFYNFLQAIYELDEKLLDKARNIKWITEHDFQQDNIKEWSKNFNPCPSEEEPLEKSGYTFFWGEFPYSQWCQTQFKVDGINYCTAEQFMMAEKAILFGDEETRQDILKTSSPKEQKQLGRAVVGFDVEVWEQNMEDIVYRGNYEKFTQNEGALDILMNSKGILVEASPYDRIWGIGMGIEEEGIEDSSNWRGLNLLGQILTRLREDLMENIIIG